MSGHCDADFTSCRLCDGIRHFIGNRRILVVGEFLLIFFLGELGVFLGDRALRYDDDRKAASVLVSLLNSFYDFVDVIRDFRNQDDVRAACDSRVERKPADLMSHDLHDEDAPVGARCRVDVVDALRRDIDRALESECHIGAPQIVVDRLGECDDVQSFLAEEIGCLGGSVTATHDQAVELQFVIGLLHRLYFVQAVLVGLTDRLERNTACSQDRAASCKDSLEILTCEHMELAVNKALVAVLKSIELNGLLGIVHHALKNAAHRSIQCLAVSAARQKTNSQHLSFLLLKDKQIISLNPVPLPDMFPYCLHPAVAVQPHGRCILAEIHKICATLYQ